MAAITLASSGKKLKLNAGFSILNNLLQNDILINHKCGGKMQCGTCRIKILNGAQYLSPISEQEKKLLKKVNARENERLACQAFAYRDITIDFNV